MLANKCESFSETAVAEVVVEPLINLQAAGSDIALEAPSFVQDHSEVENLLTISSSPELDTACPLSSGTLPCEEHNFESSKKIFKEAPQITSRVHKRNMYHSVKEIATKAFALFWGDSKQTSLKLSSAELSNDDQGISIGKIYVHLLDAYRTDVGDAADGDYYASCSIVDSSGPIYYGDAILEKDTHIVLNNAAPTFNCKFEFDVPHFRCGVRLTLLDGNSGRKIGTSDISIYSLIQVSRNL